jgi:hypothetical protein
MLTLTLELQEKLKATFNEWKDHVNGNCFTLQHAEDLLKDCMMVYEDGHVIMKKEEGVCIDSKTNCVRKAGGQKVPVYVPRNKSMAKILEYALVGMERMKDYLCEEKSSTLKSVDEWCNDMINEPLPLEEAKDRLKECIMMYEDGRLIVRRNTGLSIDTITNWCKASKQKIPVLVPMKKSVAEILEHALNSMERVDKYGNAVVKES